MHKVPITVYTIWFKDHIHTDCDGRLAIFDRLKCAEGWLEKYGGLMAKNCKVRKMLVTPYFEPEKKKRVRFGLTPSR